MNHVNGPDTWRDLVKEYGLNVKTLWEAFTIFHVWQEKKHQQPRFQHLCSDRNQDLDYFVALMLALKLHHSVFIDVEREIKPQRQQYVYDLERAIFENSIDHGQRFTLYELAVLNNNVEESYLESLCYIESFPQHSLSAQDSLDHYAQALGDFQNGINTTTSTYAEEIRTNLEKLLSLQNK